MDEDRSGAAGGASPAPTGDAEVESSVETWLGHIKVLAGDIGARLPTSEGEARALDYCERVLREAGLRPRTDSFVSTGSVFRPHLPAAAGFLLAFALYPVAFPLTAYAAAAMAAFFLFCEVRELTLRPNPLHALLPKRPSRNVFAVVEPSQAVRRDIVLIGHVDTQRTPLIFRSAGWMKAYRAFSVLAFASFVLQPLAYLGGAVFGWNWAWPASGAAAVSAVLLIALCLEAEASPSTMGANDNATGAGLVLTLAGELASRPLSWSRVWCLCSGCEEAVHEGAKAFFAAHRGRMPNPKAVAFEMLGCDGPAWVVKEGFVLPLWSDPGLRRLAARVAAENPELGARPAHLSGGVTEMSDAILAGVPAITLIGLTPEGTAPHWHRPSDTVDKMDPGAMARNYRFVQALLRAMDTPELEPPG